MVPRVPGGEITPEQLILIGEVARDFGLYTKITGGQRIDLFGARVEQLPEIWRRLVDGGMESGHAYGKALRTVKSCVGSDWCRYGQQDSVQHGHRPGAALPRAALAAQDQDGGLRLRPRVRRGPRQGRRRHRHRERLEPLRRRQRRHDAAARRAAGRRPRRRDADPLHRPVPDVLHPHRRPAAAHRAVGGGLDGGLDHVRDVVCNDCLGLAAEFEAAMERHVDGYACEWKGVLDDPEKLSRFVSFVNAPDVADPTIEFTERIGRKVPIGMPTIRTATQIQETVMTLDLDRNRDVPE